jgi:hypothetical protein
MTAEFTPTKAAYAAYVLARAERARQAAMIAARRNNLLRKETRMATPRPTGPYL